MHCGPIWNTANRTPSATHVRHLIVRSFVRSFTAGFISFYYKFFVNVFHTWFFLVCFPFWHTRIPPNDTLSLLRFCSFACSVYLSVEPSCRSYYYYHQRCCACDISSVQQISTYTGNFSGIVYLLHRIFANSIQISWRETAFQKTHTRFNQIFRVCKTENIRLTRQKLPFIKRCINIDVFLF